MVLIFSTKITMTYVVYTANIHVPNVRDVVSILKLRYTTRHHHSEQVEEEGSTLSQLQEGIFTQLLEPVQS